MVWRKKSDGFDWHKHVRTTIKLRREDRQRRIDMAQQAAVAGIKGAGRAGVAAGASGIGLLNKLIVAPVQMVADTLIAILGATSAMLTRLLTPVAGLLERRGLAAIATLVGLITTFLGLARVAAEGWTVVALAVSAAGLILLALVIVPPLATGRGRPVLDALRGIPRAFQGDFPRLGSLSRPATGALVAVAVLVGVVGAGWYAARSGVKLPINAGTLASITGLGRKPVAGKATAVSGDLLRLNGETLRLSGIEAPEPEQTCGGQGRERRSRCGGAAQSALGELLRGKTIVCDIGSADPKGYPLATCRIGEKDIAAELVARGHVFAESGLMSSYGRLEREAQSQKLGIWRSGGAERPADFRARLWEAAKRSAPDGCPIKGHVSGNTRVYVLPWSSEYPRTKVRNERGGRWFCTEREAIAAGWKPAERG